MYRLVGTALAPDTVASVLSAVRSQLDLTPGPGGSVSTAPVQTAAALRPLLSDAFDRPWSQARVFGVYPSAQLVGHCDPPIRGTRYHLPIDTNPDCWVFHDGAWQQLQIGQCYEMDPTQPHGAVNWGSTLRLHVVIDMED